VSIIVERILSDILKTEHDDCINQSVIYKFHSKEIKVAHYYKDYIAIQGITELRVYDKRTFNLLAIVTIEGEGYTDERV
jgi:hypothetical protein